MTQGTYDRRWSSYRGQAVWDEYEDADHRKLASYVINWTADARTNGEALDEGLRKAGTWNGRLPDLVRVQEPFRLAPEDVLILSREVKTEPNPSTEVERKVTLVKPARGVLRRSGTAATKSGVG